MDVRDLVSELDCPRTTIQRNLSILAKRGWVEDTPSGYAITTAGCFVRRAFVDCRDRIETVQRMAPFFEAVDAPPNIDLATLGDPRVTTPCPDRPHAPTERLFEAFADVDRIHGCVPAISAIVLERFHDRTDESTSHAYVLTESAFETLRTRFADSTAGRCCETYVYDGGMPYGLFVADDRLALTAYDEFNRLQVLIETTSKPAVEWGERVYEGHRRQSSVPQPASAGI